MKDVIACSNRQCWYNSYGCCINGQVQRDGKCNLK